MFGLHGWDLILILLVVVMIFGARRLPQLGEALGKSLNALKGGLNEHEEKVSVEEVKEDEPV